MRFEDLNPALRARLVAEHGFRLPETGANGGSSNVGNSARSRKAQKGPNVTESAYNEQILAGNGVYEGITLRLPGGSRYTPDWMDVLPDGRIRLHEVKGAYRLPSHGRAWTAFREACAAFWMFDWVWAERQKDGSWIYK